MSAATTASQSRRRPAQNCSSSRIPLAATALVHASSPSPLALPDQAEEPLRQFLRDLHLRTLLRQPLDDGGLLGGDGLLPPDQPPDGGARRGRWGAGGGFAAGLAPRAPLPGRQLRSPRRYRPIDGGRGSREPLGDDLFP